MRGFQRSVLLFLVLVLCALLTWGCAGSGKMTEEDASGNGAGENSGGEQGLLVGRPAPGFTLNNLRGETVSLEEFEGKTVLLVFWETWCPYCHEENSFIDALSEKYGGGDSAVLTVDLMQRDTPQAVKDYMQENGFSFPVLLDTGAEVGRDYRVRWLPTQYVINPEGEVIYENFGPVDAEKIEQLLGGSGS